MVSKNASASQTDSLKAAYQTAKEDSTKIRILYDLGRNFNHAGLPDSSIVYLDKCLRLLDGNSKLIKYHIDALNYIGICYIMKGDYTTALEYYYKILPLANKGNDFGRLGNAYRLIADSYSLMLKTDTAEVLYDTAIKHLKEWGKPLQIATAMHNKGNNFRRAGQYKDALESYKLSLPFYEKASPMKGNADTYEEIGVCYTHLKEYGLAEEYLHKALDIVKQISGEKRFKSHIENNLINLYFDWNKPQEAMKYALLTYEHSRSAGLDDFLLNATEKLYFLYKKEGNIIKSLHYLEEYNEVLSNIRRSESEKALQAVRVGYENSIIREQNLHQEERLKLQEKQQKMLLWFLSILALLIALLILNSRRIIIQRKEIQRQNQELDFFNNNLEERVAEKTIQLDRANRDLIRLNDEIVESLVRGQTIERKRLASELHDNLGSQLTAIKWLYSTLENSSGSIEYERRYIQLKELIDNSYKAVRDISHNMLPEEFSTSGLLGAVKKMFQNLNDTGKLSFVADFTSYKSLNPRKELELYHILMELATNTLKHSDGSNVYLEVSSSESGTVLSYHDSGTFNYNNAASTGRGLKNINERLDLIGASLESKTTRLKELSYNSVIIRL